MPPRVFPPRRGFFILMVYSTGQASFPIAESPGAFHILLLTQGKFFSRHNSEMRW